MGREVVKMKKLRGHYVWGRVGVYEKTLRKKNSVFIPVCFRFFLDFQFVYLLSVCVCVCVFFNVSRFKFLDL